MTLRFLLALRSIVLRRKEELIEMDKIEHLYSVEEIMQYFNPSLTLLKDPHHIDDLLKLYTPEFVSIASLFRVNVGTWSGCWGK